MRISDYTTKIVQTKHIVDYYWPKIEGKNVGRIYIKNQSEFLEAMRKCSIEQLKFYWASYDKVKMARAIWTLKQLNRNNPEISSAK